MASPLKCPSPNCTFLFDPAQVPPGAVIACPRCGLRFQLGPMAPAYPGYAPPPGYGPPAPEPEPVSSFQEDLFASTADEPISRPKSGGKKGAASKGPRQKAGEEPPKTKASSGSLKSILIAAGIVLGIAAVGFGIVILSFINKANRDRVETDTEIKYPDLNLQFKKPASDSGWTRHDETLRIFNAALFGYVKGDETSPSAWIFGDARRLDHAAGETDLRGRASDLLNGNFDNVTEVEEARDDTLCGLPAKRYLYRASSKKHGETVIIEVLAAANKAVGIWVFAWAAERDFSGVAGAFKEVRSGLQIAKVSDTNIDAPSSTKTHRSKSGIFTIKDNDGLWVKKDPPTSVDTNGTLWLRGTPRGVAGKNKPTTVDLAVAEIVSEGDPKQQAMEYVKKTLPAGNPTIEELTAEPTGDPPAGELNPATPVTRLKVRYKGADSSVNKLVVFAAVESNGKLVVAYADCQWKDLQYWEQRLMQVIGSLEPKKK